MVDEQIPSKAAVNDVQEFIASFDVARLCNAFMYLGSSRSAS